MRNKLAGLCTCGRARRESTLECPCPKTCADCYARSQGVSRPTARRDEPRHYVQLHVEHDPRLIGEWYSFCEEQQIPLATAFEDAMELYISLTRKEQEHDVQDSRTHILRLVG